MRRLSRSVVGVVRKGKVLVVIWRCLHTWADQWSFDGLVFRLLAMLYIEVVM